MIVATYVVASQPLDGAPTATSPLMPIVSPCNDSTFDDLTKIQYFVKILNILPSTFSPMLVSS